MGKERRLTCLDKIEAGIITKKEKESGGCFIATAATGSIFLKRFWFCRSLDMVKICLNMKKIDSKRLEKAYRGK